MSKLAKFLKKPYMLRLTLTQCVTRCVFALAFLLLWRQFINRELPMISVGFFVMGVLLFVLAWFSYLGLDGLEAPVAHLKILNKKQKSSRKRTNDMIDYVEEDVVTLDELSDEDRHVCKLISNFLSGTIFFIPGFIASVM